MLAHMFALPPMKHFAIITGDVDNHHYEIQFNREVLRRGQPLQLPPRMPFFIHKYVVEKGQSRFTIEQVSMYLVEEHVKGEWQQLIFAVPADVFAKYHMENGLDGGFSMDDRGYHVYIAPSHVHIPDYLDTEKVTMYRAQVKIPWEEKIT